jgi:hypothetical protein
MEPEAVVFVSHAWDTVVCISHLQRDASLSDVCVPVVGGLRTLAVRG